MYCCAQGPSRERTHAHSCATALGESGARGQHSQPPAAGAGARSQQLARCGRRRRERALPSRGAARRSTYHLYRRRSQACAPVQCASGSAPLTPSARTAGGSGRRSRLLRAQHGLRRGEARDGHAQRGAGHIVEAHALEELDRLGVAAVLAWGFETCVFVLCVSVVRVHAEARSSPCDCSSHHHSLSSSLGLPCGRAPGTTLSSCLPCATLISDRTHIDISPTHRRCRARARGLSCGRARQQS